MKRNRLKKICHDMGIEVKPIRFKRLKICLNKYLYCNFDVEDKFPTIDQIIDIVSTLNEGWKPLWGEPKALYFKSKEDLEDFGEHFKDVYEFYFTPLNKT